MDKTQWAEWAQGHPPIYMRTVDKKDVWTNAQNGQWTCGQNGHKDRHTPIYMHKVDKNDIQISGQDGQLRGQKMTCRQEDRNDKSTRDRH